jgi:hypothetical protein
MRRADTLRKRIGRRGGILLLFAVVDFAYGGSLLAPTAAATIGTAVGWRQHYAPIWVWGATWLFVGTVLMIGAFSRRDEFAYAVAIGWKIIWSLTSVASWLFGDVQRGWVSAFIWGFVAGIVGVISGWPEPVVAPPDPDPEG